jgi:hypothetical protein
VEPFYPVASRHKSLK